MLKTKAIFVVLFWLCIKFSIAQNNAIVGFYSPNYLEARDPKPTLQASYTIIPIKLAGSLMLIEASVDNQTGYFIFDTGAPYLVLNSTYFRDYPRTQAYAAIGVNNYEVDIFRTEVDSLKIREILYGKLEADVADLSHIENSRNIKILGLLGTNLFKNFTLSVDVAQQNIKVSKGETNYDEQLYLKIPFKIKNNSITFKGKINQTVTTFVFDTGAEVNVLDNDLDDIAYESFRITNRSLLTGSVGEQIDVFTGTLSSVSIASYSFNDMKTIMTNLEGIGKVYGYNVDAILGFPFIKKAPIHIDFKEKVIWIDRNKLHE